MPLSIRVHLKLKSSAMDILLFSVILTSCVIKISSESPESYVVTSKPYYVQPKDNLHRMTRNFNFEENEIGETDDAEEDCESTPCRNEDYRNNYHATFKPFPQEMLEKILKKYHKDKIHDKLINKLNQQHANEISSTVSFQPVTTEETFDKSKSWSLVNADTNAFNGNTNEEQEGERVGWVTLEPVAWSNSQIQKWKPNVQQIDSIQQEEESHAPWDHPVVSKPETMKWNMNKPTWNSNKPSHELNQSPYEFAKPAYNPMNQDYESLKSYETLMKPTHDSLKPTYDPLKPIYESLKPTYEPLKPTQQSLKVSYDAAKPLYNSVIKPIHEPIGISFQSTKPTVKPIKPSFDYSEKPNWGLSQNLDRPTHTQYQSPWNNPSPVGPMPPIITEQMQNQYPQIFGSNLHGSSNYKPWGTLDMNTQASSYPANPFYLQTSTAKPSTSMNDGDGRWVLLSSTKEYSGSDRQRSLGKSFKNSEFYRNSIPLTIVPALTESKKQARSYGQPERKIEYIPLWNISNTGEHRGKAIPLIVTPHRLSDKSSNRTSRKIESFNNFLEPKNNSSSRTARRMVRLTVLPPLNNTNITTSHNGMIEVEDTRLTVDESHREHLARMMKFENKKSEFEDKFNRMQREIKSDETVSSLPSASSSMSVMLPVVIGRRRRRYDDNAIHYYPHLNNIATATH